MSRVRRIALISPFLTRPARGIERFTVELAKRLGRRAGYHVDLITWKESDDWPWGDLGPGVSVIRLRLPRYWRRFWASWAYAFYCLTNRPAVLQIFFTWHGEGGMLRLIPGYCRRVMLNLHFPISIAGHRYEQISQSGLDRKVGKLVGVSQVVCRDAEARFGRSVELVHNGVDLDRFSRVTDPGKLRDRMGVPATATVFSTVAALEERKNIRSVILAFEMAARQLDDAVLLVAGEGPERTSLETLIETRGLQDRVLLLGNQSRIEEVYQVSDCFVFLGRGEAMPLAPIEAMACGLPIVSALFEPLPDLLCGEGTVFVDGESIDGVAAEMVRLGQDPEQGLAMGRANRFFVEKEYSWEKTVDGYVGVYESIKT